MLMLMLMMIVMAVAAAKTAVMMMMVMLDVMLTVATAMTTSGRLVAIRSANVETALIWHTSRYRSIVASFAEPTT